ncbi:MAG: GNAT family N-acetyltransferase [Verrucomicrobiaceae bacterium]
MGIKIRPEVQTDHAAIEAVTIAAFLNAEHTSHTEQHVIDGLRKAGRLDLSLVAEKDGEIVGHVAVSPVVLSDGTPGWFGLGPISVTPQYQRQGIGSKLMREALGQLRAMGAGGCVVLGDPQYYGRFGFKAEAGIVLPDVPAEYFMAAAFGSVIPSGHVAYHEAFEA